MLFIPCIKSPDGAGGLSCSLCPFDYFLGDTIAIEKLKSSIVINNKGELLFPESEFGKKSEARNRLLADLLTRTSFMEKAGTGIKRVTDSCKANGNKVNFYFSDSFWVTIHSNQDVTEDVTERLSKILEYIKINNNITTVKLAGKLGVSKRTVLRDIEKLKNENKLLRVGDEKTGSWKIIGR